jgi:hypothetical protein
MNGQTARKAPTPMHAAPNVRDRASPIPPRTDAQCDVNPRSRERVAHSFLRPFVWLAY